MVPNMNEGKNQDEVSLVSLANNKGKLFALEAKEECKQVTIVVLDKTEKAQCHADCNVQTLTTDISCI